MSLGLASCGGSSAFGSANAVPAAKPVGAASNSVEVKAIFGDEPIAGVEVSLTLDTWPDGKLIAKGKTNARGRVTLSGKWTTQDVVCAGGRYERRKGVIIKQWKCPTPPIPKYVTLRFL